ncbi:MAG TPA: R3H domain-containing nucleic acid-binding protein [Candidatus Dormibacteraeota bacterium]|nr:R3H domain-containing nucleic acid-binding protein [Candidatus Dormibacteraeota bacterium]
MSYRFSTDGRLEREESAQELGRFLDRIIGDGGFDLSYRIENVPPQPDAIDRVEVRVSFEGPDQDLLLERNGELLQAIEFLAVRWLRLDPHLYDHVQLDAADYRAARLEELKLSARIAAQRVVETGQPFRFNPMPGRERRILHLVLAENPAVRSESEGQGEERQLVVHPVKPLRPKR